MRKLIVLSSALLAASAPVAHAYDGCFERTYDASHMAKHTGQTVTAVKLRLKPRSMDDGYNVAAEMRVAFRGGNDDYYAGGICQDRKDSLYCGLEQDAGQVAITAEGVDIKLSPITDVRTESASGNEEDVVVIAASNPEHRTFLLRAASSEACRVFDDDGQ